MRQLLLHFEPGKDPRTHGRGLVVAGAPVAAAALSASQCQIHLEEKHPKFMEHFCNEGNKEN